MLNKFNKLKKEVKKVNENLSNYVINEITKIVYQSLKNSKSTGERMDLTIIDNIINDFWYANRQAKNCSNRDTLRKYNFLKISNGEKLLKISQNEVANKYLVEKLGNFYEYVLKHGSAYIPQNRFGKYENYLKFAN